MKKFIIGIIASLAVNRTVKREFTILIYKIYNHVSYTLNARPKESLRALQNINADFKKNQKKYGERLAREYKFNFKKFFTDLFTAELQKILAEPKKTSQKVSAMGPMNGPSPVVNQFFNNGPGPGAAGASAIKDTIAQGAINFFNSKNPSNPITDAEIVAAREALARKRRMS